MPRLPNPIRSFVTRAWYDPLRRYIYLLLWPWFIPAVSYLIFGDAYVAGWQSFGAGTLVVLLLCAVANEVDTNLMKVGIRRYPALGQSAWRVGWMLVSFGLVNGLLAEGSLRLFDATRFLHYTYRPGMNTWVLIFVFVSSVVAAALIESAYAFTQWQTNQVEVQSLERDNLRIRLDDLKSRINPHFLFNSLNAVSLLISDDPGRAEEFVDEMAKVYRYLLQANKTPLVPLDTEIRFMHSYVRLLEARYPDALHVTFAIDPAFGTCLLPPLSLQILLDDIIQHNTLLARQPLRIALATDRTGRLRVSHNRRPRTVLIDRQLPGIDDVTARYRWLSAETPTVETTDADRTVSLPLLPTDTVPPDLLPT